MKNVRRSLVDLRKTVEDDAKRQKIFDNLLENMTSLAKDTTTEGKAKWAKLEGQFKAAYGSFDKVKDAKGADLIAEIKTLRPNSFAPGLALNALADEVGGDYPRVAEKERLTLAANRINYQIDNFVKKMPPTVYQFFNQWFGMSEQETFTMLASFIKSFVADALANMSPKPKSPFNALVPRFNQIGKSLHFKAALDKERERLDQMGPRVSLAGPEKPLPSDGGVKPLPALADIKPETQRPLDLQPGTEDRWSECYDARMKQARLLNSPALANLAPVNLPAIPTIEQMRTPTGMKAYMVEIDKAEAAIKKARTPAIAEKPAEKTRDVGGLKFPEKGGTLPVGEMPMIAKYGTASDTKEVTFQKKAGSYIVKLKSDDKEITIDGATAVDLYTKEGNLKGEDIQILVGDEKKGATLSKLVEAIEKDKKEKPAARSLKATISNDKVELKK